MLDTPKLASLTRLSLDGPRKLVENLASLVHAIIDPAAELFADRVAGSRTER